MEKPTIILASASPLRKSLLEQMEIPCRVMQADIDESVADELEPLKRPERIAEHKVKAVVAKLLAAPPAPDLQKTLVVGADTLLVLGGKAFGKAKDRAQAKAFLQAFSGCTHQAVTGMALYNFASQSLSARTNITEVTFCALSESEIDSYLDTGEWQNAAGAYRIQGKASMFIKSIGGSYSSVAGLPLSDFYAMLKAQNYPVWG